MTELEIANNNHHVAIETYLTDHDTKRPPFILRWDKISYNVVTKKKRGKAVNTKCILHECSGIVKPGQLLAVMGSSGAGKTTLLNLLAGRVRGGEVSGTVTVNGRPMTKKHKRYIG